MDYIICNLLTIQFLSKNFTEKPFDSIMDQIGPVYYHICTNYDFAFSKIHFDLSDEKWVKLNFNFYQCAAEGEIHEAHGNNPPYLE